MIGDTIHDFEVAEEAGIGCILVAGGHQSKERLESTGTQVIGNLTELIRFRWVERMAQSLMHRTEAARFLFVNRRPVCGLLAEKIRNQA